MKDQPEHLNIFVSLLDEIKNHFG